MGSERISRAHKSCRQPWRTTPPPGWPLWRARNRGHPRLTCPATSCVHVCARACVCVRYKFAERINGLKISPEEGSKQWFSPLFLQQKARDLILWHPAIWCSSNWMYKTERPSSLPFFSPRMIQRFKLLVQKKNHLYNRIKYWHGHYWSNIEQKISRRKISSEDFQWLLTDHGLFTPLKSKNICNCILIKVHCPKYHWQNSFAFKWLYS